MKFSKYLLALAALFTACATTFAQADLAGSTRTILVQSPTAFTGTSITNGPIDIAGSQGTALLNVAGYVTGTGTLLVSLYSSPDTTNLTASTGYQLAIGQSIISTNYFYSSTGIKATNTWFLPGTLTTPTASSSGWATPYLSPAAWTSTGTVSIANTNALIAFNAQDSYRYVYVVISGTATNAVSTATLTKLNVGRP